MNIKMNAIMPAAPRVWGPASVATLLALVVSEALWARRRYREAPPNFPAVDVTVVPAVAVTVVPADLSTSGALPVEIAAFGDSAMEGVGVAEVAHSLPVQLAQRVADGLNRPVHVVGYSRSGARTTDVLTHQVPRAPGRHDVAVLLVGTNDVFHLTPPRALIRDSGALLDALTDLGSPVVASGLPEFRAMRALPHPLREAAHMYGMLVRAVQRRAASRRTQVHLIDVSAAVGREFVRDTSTMSADCFHPSATGYGRIADAMTPTLLSVLAALRTAPEDTR